MPRAYAGIELLFFEVKCLKLLAKSYFTVY